MAYLTDVNHNDSDSDDLPAVDTVLHGNGIARNQNSMHATGGSRNGNARDIRIKSYRVETRAIGGSMIIQRNGYKEMKNNCNSKVNKRFEEDVHASILEKKSARRFRQVILDESDEEDNDELEVENDGKDAGRPVPVTKESMLSVDERHTRKGEMTKKGSNTSETAHISQIWKSIHASRYSESDEETDLEGKGDLETRFANIRLLCDRNGSNKSCDGSRLSLSSKIIGLGAGSGQRGRPTTPEQNPPIRGDQDSNERSEAKPETKSRLISPTKRKQQQQQQQQQQHPRIHSASEFRESGETFWRQSFINQWNDSYSPDKKILSPKKFISDEQHDFSKLPNFSGRGQEKNSVIVKPDREAARQKKLFRVTKQKTAEAFLAEVDQEVTGGRIGELCRNTGGVNLIWSKKLVSTAGRAQWKRIKPKTENSNHEVSTSEQHYASIELAEKVIDNDNRLKNVIAHEFCHLANFMISGVKDNPHGKSFKEWYFCIYYMQQKSLFD